MGNTKFCNAVPCKRVKSIPLEVEQVTDEIALVNAGFKCNRLFFFEEASSSKFSIR